MTRKCITQKDSLENTLVSLTTRATKHKVGEPSPHKLINYPLFCNEKIMYLDGFLFTKERFQPIEKGNLYLQSNQVEYI